MERINNKGITDVISYCKKNNIKFVSKQKFADMKGLSKEADKFIEAMLCNNNNYQLLANLQKEHYRGFINSGNVTLRDLYAA